jgi:hypothetical protein
MKLAAAIAVILVVAVAATTAIRRLFTEPPIVPLEDDDWFQEDTYVAALARLARA